MLDISRFSTRYSVRTMTDADADVLLAFCKENTQYYQYCGKQPSRELILSDLHITPPDTPISAKHYVGFFDDGILVAILDLIDGYPDSSTAFIGFFMMNQKRQGRQIGSGIVQELCQYLKQTEKKRVLLGIDKGNPQSTHFWKKNGFVVIREVAQEEGTILVAEKSLL